MHKLSAWSLLIHNGFKFKSSDILHESIKIKCNVGIYLTKVVVLNFWLTWNTSRLLNYWKSVLDFFRKSLLKRLQRSLLDLRKNNRVGSWVNVPQRVRRTEHTLQIRLYSRQALYDVDGQTHSVTELQLFLFQEVLYTICNAWLFLQRA